MRESRIGGAGARGGRDRIDGGHHHPPPVQGKGQGQIGTSAFATALLLVDPSAPPDAAPFVRPAFVEASFAQAQGTTVPQGAPGVPAPAADPAQGEADTREVVVTGRRNEGDPLSAVNAESFAVTQAVDQAVIGPVARAYKRTVPNPIRLGLRNFIANLREPVAALNYLLQLKPGKAGETLGRFAINTTVGVGGIVDVARKKPFNLPRRRNSLANTLGYYGVGPGPFLFLPLIGPVTVRDLIGNVIDQVAVPVTTVPPLDNPAITIPLLNLGALDFRAENDGAIARARASRDPYAAVRKAYLDRRQAEIDALRGSRRPRGGAVPPPVNAAPGPRVIAVPPAAL